MVVSNQEVKTGSSGEKKKFHITSRIACRGSDFPLPCIFVDAFPPDVEVLVLLSGRGYVGEL